MEIREEGRKAGRREERRKERRKEEMKARKRGWRTSPASARLPSQLPLGSPLSCAQTSLWPRDPMAEWEWAVCGWSRAARLLAAAIYCRSKAALSCGSQRPWKPRDGIGTPCCKGRRTGWELCGSTDTAQARAQAQGEAGSSRLEANLTGQHLWLLSGPRLPICNRRGLSKMCGRVTGDFLSSSYSGLITSEYSALLFCCICVS